MNLRSKFPRRCADKPKVIELFAGAGSFSHAFQKEGFQICAAYERDEMAAATYADNLGSHIKICDLSKYRPEGRADVLIAGPPFRNTHHFLGLWFI